MVANSAVAAVRPATPASAWPGAEVSEEPTPEAPGRIVDAAVREAAQCLVPALRAPILLQAQQAVAGAASDVFPAWMAGPIAPADRAAAPAVFRPEPDAPD